MNQEKEVRLIDANEFRRFVHEQVGEDVKLDADMLLDAIDSQDTAYDVEEVVKQLQVMALEEDAPIYEGDIEADSWVRVNKVIEVVKAGGK